MKKLKHIVYFIKWWYSKLNKIVFFFTTSVTSIILGVLLLAPWSPLKVVGAFLCTIGMIGMLSLFVYLSVIDPLKKRYSEFKKEQRDMLYRLDD